MSIYDMSNQDNVILGLHGNDSHSSQHHHVAQIQR
jgi:hypothetical protein